MSKKSALLPIALVALFSLFLAACAVEDTQVGDEPSAEEVKQEAEEAIEAVEGYTVGKKEAFEQQVEAKLDELETQIAELRAEAESSGEDSTSGLSEEISALEEQVGTIRSDLDEFKSASADAWEDLEIGINAALEELEAAYDQALSHFNEG